MIDCINLFNDVKKRFVILDSGWSEERIGFTMMCVCVYVCIFLYSMSTILERRSARIDNIKMIPGSKIDFILREKPEET